MNLVRKIIHTYLFHPMPDRVQEHFRSWILDKEHAREKESVLREEWDRLDPAEVFAVDERSYRRKLGRLHREMHVAPKARLITLSRRAAAVAAAVVVLLMGVEFFVVKHLAADSTTWLVTAENSKGRFTLPDGSTVWLNADSRLAYRADFAENGHRRVRLDGEAFFDVKRDTLAPFEVTMDELQVRVLGTRFMASHIDDFGIEEVTLQSGSVEVEHLHSQERIRLVPDQNCTFDASTGLTTVRNVVADNYCSWTGDSIVFDNMTLGEIAVNLEHWYNIRIRIESDVDPSVRISFTLRPETLDETLRIIENLTHYHCLQIDKHHISIRK